MEFATIIVQRQNKILRGEGERGGWGREHCVNWDLWKSKKIYKTEDEIYPSFINDAKALIRALSSGVLSDDKDYFNGNDFLHFFVK